MNEQASVMTENTNVATDTRKLDLNSPGVAAQVAKRLGADIDLWAQKTYDTGPRSHLGASLIGHDCLQYLWLHFRWAKHEKFTGRMLRLFQRGHREEHTFNEYLRGIGCQVWEFDDANANEEDKGKRQFRISGSGGHFGGSLDGVVVLPPSYGIDEPMLLEYKTNGTGQGFHKLGSEGMAIAKPQHFAQTSTYGFAYGFRFVCYMNVNKNDDFIHIEIVKLNENLGRQQFAKAEKVITSQIPMGKISASPATVPCTYCAYKGICHNGDLPEKNCRSCVNAVPIAEAKWFCKLHDAQIPGEAEIKAACPSWSPIINGQ